MGFNKNIFMKTKIPKTPEQFIETEKKFRKSLLYSNLGFSIVLWLLFFFVLHSEFILTTITIQLIIFILWLKTVSLSKERQRCVVENKPVKIPKPTFLSKLFCGNLFNINIFKNGADNKFKIFINKFINSTISFIILMIYIFVLMIIIVIIAYFSKKFI